MIHPDDVASDEHPIAPVEAEPIVADADAVALPDERQDLRFAGLIVFVVALLLLCVALILIADRHPPAGL